MSKLPDIKTQFPEWYQEVVYQAELADQAPVRGCMVVRPYGYAMWEKIRNRLDDRIKHHGAQNALFPLLIPESFIKKEADHVDGFAPELAVVTHAGGKQLEEPLVVRPTSETIVHYMFSRWIHSWRDLPFKINQWANVVRWEKRPRAFLRTSEFFWQEGHTAHETYEQAEKMARDMLQEYINLAHDYLAIPVISGPKSAGEKFPGADITLTYEAFMPDGKAVQMGTSHLLSPSFAKSFEIVYQDRDGKQAHPYLTSWGATTRLVGAVIMTHGDQKGLVLPPKIAPIQVVIIPIFRKGEDDSIVLNAAQKLAASLKGVRVEIDDDAQKSPGKKFFYWELKGVPIRIEIGPRDVANNQAVVADRLGLDKKAVALDAIANTVKQGLQEIQETLFKRAQERLQAMWFKQAKIADFGNQLEKEGGFYQTGWCGSEPCETSLKNYKSSIRCVLEEKSEFTTCFNCDQNSTSDIVVAKSY